MAATTRVCRARCAGRGKLYVTQRSGLQERRVSERSLQPRSLSEGVLLTCAARARAL
jgi:hypothetical protein